MTEAVDLRRQLFVSAVMGYWQQNYDTWWIASTLGKDESEIERVLHEGLELEHKQKRERERGGRH